MARVPLTEQSVAEDWLILNLENVAFSDEQFIELCADFLRFQLVYYKMSASTAEAVTDPRFGHEMLRVRWVGLDLLSQ